MCSIAWPLLCGAARSSALPSHRSVGVERCVVPHTPTDSSPPRSQPCTWSEPLLPCPCCPVSATCSPGTDTHVLGNPNLLLPASCWALWREQALRKLRKLRGTCCGLPACRSSPSYSEICSTASSDLLLLLHKREDTGPGPSWPLLLPFYSPLNHKLLNQQACAQGGQGGQRVYHSSPHWLTTDSVQHPWPRVNHRQQKQRLWVLAVLLGSLISVPVAVGPGRGPLLRDSESSPVGLGQEQQLEAMSATEVPVVAATVTTANGDSIAGSQDGKAPSTTPAMKPQPDSAVLK